MDKELCEACSNMKAAVITINDQIVIMNTELERFGNDSLLEDQVVALDNSTCILAERIEECCNVVIDN